MLLKAEPILPVKKGFKKLTENPDLYFYEQKLDGWRCLAYIHDGAATLCTKHGLQHRGFKQIRRELVVLGFDEAVFDGEIVCLDEQGNPNFSALMRRSEPQYFFAFDVLWLNGLDVRRLPLLDRKGIVAKIFQGSGGVLRYVEHSTFFSSKALFESIKARNWEGAVAKLKDAQYDPSIPDNWVKVLNPSYTETKHRWKWFRDRK